MCGIAGIVRPRGVAVSPTEIVRMTDVLHRRGPDADGLFVDGNVGLGHRRLSIIDTAAVANQPLFNEDGQVAVVFNGEIYNFGELRAELVAHGHRFATRSDTEVLVHGWEQYGVDLLGRLRGMFAIALLDRRAGRLLLARDRLGKKPLYYAVTPTGLLFGSELKALRTIGGYDDALDPQALRDYVAYGCTAGARTIHRGVHKLPPAHYAVIDVRAAAPSLTTVRYWDVAPRPEEGRSEEDWLDELDAELSEAVRLRMISDVPLGAFLSGGIDSSLITAYMTRHAARVETFCIGFSRRSHDESGHAAAVAAHLGTTHHVEIVEPDAIAVLPDLIEAFDEPFADPSALPTFYLSQLARRRVTVALSGDGGDELDLGYPRYPRAQLLQRISQRIGPVGRAAVAAATRLVPIGQRARVIGERLRAGGFALYANELGLRDGHLSLLRRELRDTLPPVELDPDGPAGAYAHLPGASHLQRAQYTDLQHYLPDDILAKVDRTSMWHSLEVRAPLLDHRLIELAARIPTALKLDGFDGKRLLRRLLYRHVPRALVDRPKMGFGVPLAAWFRRELRPALDEMVADRGSPMWGSFDHAVAADRVRRHRLPGMDLETSLWRLLVFYRWSRRYSGTSAPSRSW